MYYCYINHINQFHFSVNEAMDLISQYRLALYFFLFFKRLSTFSTILFWFIISIDKN